MQNHYNIDSLEVYNQACQDATNTPQDFWDTIARENFDWIAPWESVLEHDLSIPSVSWFKGAKLNITLNCIDRHLALSLIHI